MVNKAVVEAAKPNPEGTVFISYRRDDGTEYANEIGALLRAVGLRIWRDIYNMPAGKTPEALEKVLGEETSGGVLIVTPNICESDMVINTEAPMLCRLAKDSNFPLAVANAVAIAGGKVDYGAPDEFLRTGSETLGQSNQFNILDQRGIKDLVVKLLHARMLYVNEKMQKEIRDTIVIDMQSRTPPSAIENENGDLQIRINPDDDDSGKPSKQGLEDLKIALPLVKNALENLPRNKTIRITGGMHLTPALAVGAAFPVTKPRNVEVLDSRNELWRSERDVDVPDDAIKTQVKRPYGKVEGPKNRIAVMVSMANTPDHEIFDRMVEKDELGFDKRIIISSGYKNIDPRWAATLSQRKVDEIRAEAANRPEIHLAFHGPVALAILVGRLLNTYKIIAYERLETASGRSAYRPTLKIDVGAVAPIQEVFDSSALGDDRLKRPVR